MQKQNLKFSATGSILMPFHFEKIISKKDGIILNINIEKTREKINKSFDDFISSKSVLLRLGGLN